MNKEENSTPFLIYCPAFLLSTLIYENSVMDWSPVICDVATPRYKQ